MTEHVILVAISVEAPSREAAHDLVHTAMAEVRTGVESWWVAEDDRRDGSDNDSAVFVRQGFQREALHVLFHAGLTAGHNIV